MAGFGLRPSKPQAVLTAVLCVAMLVFGITQFVREEFSWFMVLWVAVGIVVIALTLWQAFGKNGGPFRPRMEVDEPDTGLRGDRVAPSRYRVRPSKPMAVVGAVFGVALLAYGVTQFVRAGQANSFLVLWVVFGIAIIGFNLWAAFGKKGSLYSLDRLSGSDDR